MDFTHVDTTDNQVFSAFAFIGFVLAVIPLPWHLEAWNTGTCMYMFWAALGCLNLFINSVVWNRTARNLAPVWCDISTRIILALNVGIPAASLCINRRLYQIASVKTVTVTKAQKRRAVVIDLAIGMVFPILTLPLAYVTEGHRFDIYEQIGCFPATYNTQATIPLIYIWPLLIGILSAYYCSRTIYTFYKRRAQFKELLSGNDNLNSGRYFRLMGLASVDLLFTIPLSLYIIIRSTQIPIHPYISWWNVHQNFHNSILVPAIQWKNIPAVRHSFAFSRTVTIVCPYIFFAFFGFADEARKNYRSAFESLAKKVGYSTGTVGTGAGSTAGAKTGFPGFTSFGKGMGSFGKASLPVFVRRETTRTTDADLTSSGYTEKDSDRISVGSVFEDVKAKDFVATATTTSSSSASGSSRSASPAPHQLHVEVEPAPLFTPPNHSVDSPHDMV